MRPSGRYTFTVTPNTEALGLEVIKLSLFFILRSSAEHEIFSSSKYENFHIYYQRNFHAQLCLARKHQ